MTTLLELRLYQGKKLLFADVETTGGRGDTARVIELCVCRQDEDGVRKDLFTQRFNPERNIEYYASRIHGLWKEHVQNEPTFGQKARKLAAYVKGSLLVAHNAKACDSRMLEREFRLAGVDWPFVGVIDTMDFCRELWPKKPHGLKTLIENLGLSTAQEHTAEGDVKMLISLWDRILQESGIRLC